MAISVHELTEYISWASDDYLHLALSDGTDGKITKANIISGLATPGALDTYYVKRSNNLSDITNPESARANLNLGSVALLNQITKANIVDFSEADYATAVQGLLADSALQAGDNISELVNDAGYIPSSQKGVANGVASLNSNGKIPETQIPAIAITDTFVVDSEAEMLALDAQVGDVAIRNDESRSYILQGTDPSDLTDWQELKTPAGGVASVNGQTGTVVLNADDIDDTSTINKFATGAQLTKIDSVETGAEANQNAFSTISVAGQSDVIADSKTDVVTFVGVGVNISTDPVTDTITFEVTSSGGEDYPQILETSTFRTLSLTDNKKFIYCTNAAGCAITVPPQSSVAWAENTTILGISSLENCTFVTGSGVTIIKPDDRILECYAGSTWALRRLSSDVWALTGYLVDA